MCVGFLKTVKITYQTNESVFLFNRMFVSYFLSASGTLLFLYSEMKKKGKQDALTTPFESNCTKNSNFTINLNPTILNDLSTNNDTGFKTYKICFY